MNSYKTYLQQEGYSESSITHYLWRLRDYTAWCRKKRLSKDQVVYKELLKYIKYLQAKGWKPQSVNNQIRGIKYYFDYLIAAGLRLENPADAVKVRQEYTKVLSNLLSSDELEDLYYSYKTENLGDFYFTATAKRNKVITGLIVYQALNSATLAKLKTAHLQLYKGKIYVPSTRKSNSRTLELKSWQVIEIMEYINEYRPKIQQHIKLYNDALFPLNSNQFSCILNGLTKKLKQTNYKVKNVSQLRASVITLWLGRYNIREVQQMAGHKYIGSTEKYQQDNLENLQGAIKEFHPLQ